MSAPIPEDRTNDHCFVPQMGPDILLDRCAYENCGRPEIEHEWTVEADKCNPEPDAIKAKLFERIATLEAALAEAQWKPITSESLPKVGDEMWKDNPDPEEYETDFVMQVDPCHLRMSFRTLTKGGKWTHYRPINAPEAVTRAQK